MDRLLLRPSPSHRLCSSVAARPAPWAPGPAVLHRGGTWSRANLQIHFLWLQEARWTQSCPILFSIQLSLLSANTSLPTVPCPRGPHSSTHAPQLQEHIHDSRSAERSLSHVHKPLSTQTHSTHLSHTQAPDRQMNPQIQRKDAQWQVYSGGGTCPWQSQRDRRETCIRSSGGRVLGYIQSHVLTCPHSPSTTLSLCSMHTHIQILEHLHANLRQAPCTYPEQTLHQSPPLLKTPWLTQRFTHNQLHAFPHPSLSSLVQEWNKSPVPIPTGSLSSPPPWRPVPLSSCS